MLVDSVEVVAPPEPKGRLRARRGSSEERSTRSCAARTGARRRRRADAVGAVPDRLEELRLVAVEGRLEADLAAGLHAQVAGELERLVGEYPVRERLWQLLMLALYRGGRQADALAAYRRARAVLAGELGLEPGEELRELERALALGPADQQVRADLLRLLGAVLYEVGDLPSAEATLSEGYQAAAAAGSGTVQARIGVLLSQLRFQLGRCSLAETVEGCEAAAAMLESGGDPQGLAEAWLSIGALRFWQGKGPASAEAIERAEGYARRSASRYVQQQVARWLVVPYTELSTRPRPRSAVRSSCSKRPPVTRGPRPRSLPSSRYSTPS